MVVNWDNQHVRIYHHEKITTINAFSIQFFAQELIFKMAFLLLKFNINNLSHTYHHL